MSFLTNLIIFDLSLLVLFTLGVILFLVIKRKKVEREGLLYLYKTQVGVRVLDKIAKKNKWLWKGLSYLIIVVGYGLMISVLYFFIVSVWEYITRPEVYSVIKAPPVMLLIPYFPRIFGAQSFFPEFYFLYFILAIAIIAIVHEGGHGILARFYNVRIKSTGFGFLGPFLAFFVEQDDDQMQKKPIFQQLSILGAGVFMNILTALILFGAMFLFFTSFYTPIGVNVVDYGMSGLTVAQLGSGILTGDSIMVNNEALLQLKVDDKMYFVPDYFNKTSLLESYDSDKIFGVYQDQPAIRNNINGVIEEVDGQKIKSLEDLRLSLNSKMVGQEIEIKIEGSNGLEDKKVNLGESYEEPGKTVLGIVIGEKNPFRIFRIIEPFKEYGVEYRSSGNQEIIEFIYELLAWIVLINILVGFINMLPVGIFDGGRFFYLTILAITKREKVAKKSFGFATWFILFLIVAMMVVWFFRRFVGA